MNNVLIIEDDKEICGSDDGAGEGLLLSFQLSACREIRAA